MEADSSCGEEYDMADTQFVQQDCVNYYSVVMILLW